MRLVLASSFNFQITLLRYNSHSAKYIFLKYRSQVIVVTELSKHLYLISGYFHYPKRRHHTHQQLLPIFLSSQSQAFKNLWICLFWIFHINGRIPYVVFCDGLLSLTIIILQYSDTSHSYSILIVECHKLFLVYFFGRVGSQLRHAGFFVVHAGFLLWRAGFPSLAVACGLQGAWVLQLCCVGSVVCSIQALVEACELSSCGTWAQLPRGMWDLSSLTRDRTHIP